MLRRSDFIAATYALSLVLANFGIAIAARMPMMTTTIRSSISVKPFLLFVIERSGVLVNRDAPPIDSEQWKWLYRKDGVPDVCRHISLAFFAISSSTRFTQMTRYFGARQHERKRKNRNNTYKIRRRNILCQRDVFG